MSGLGSYQKLLLQEFELERAWGFLDELAVGDLNRLLGLAGIACRVEGLHGHHYRIVVLSQRGEVLGPIEGRIDRAHLRGELLLEAR